jgi:hypothetical protein
MRDSWGSERGGRRSKIEGEKKKVRSRAKEWGRERKRVRGGGRDESSEQ